MEIYGRSYFMHLPIDFTLFPIDLHVKILCQRKWPTEVSTDSESQDESSYTNYIHFRGLGIKYERKNYFSKNLTLFSMGKFNMGFKGVDFLWTK